MNDVTVVIPARFGSSRLPGKPLLAETGKPLIQHTWERVAAAFGRDSVVVATDDLRIHETVEAFGGRAIMTSSAHKTGTDRVAEVAEKGQAPYVLNVQGDEPDVDPDDLVALIEPLRQGADMATLVWPSRDEEAFGCPHTVKVAAEGDRALYFSRAKIPYDRDKGGFPGEFLIHLGVYGYRRDVLLDLSQRPQTALERTESLEQLRALAAGYTIRVRRARVRPIGIDTPEDYRRFVLRSRNEANP